MGAMFKIYRKFCQKNFGKDPLDAIEKEHRKNTGEEDEDMPLALSQPVESPEVVEENAGCLAQSIYKSKHQEEPDITLASDALTCVTALEDKQLIQHFQNPLASEWTLETLQLVKLFHLDLNERDPFYIPGQQVIKQAQPANPYQKKNIYDNFIDSEAIDNPDALEQLHQKNAAEPKILYRSFHEIAPKDRLCILLYLCQNKLDTESPEFMAEIQRITKPTPQPTQKEKRKKLEKEEGEGEDQKQSKTLELEKIEKA